MLSVAGSAAAGDGACAEGEEATSAVANRPNTNAHFQAQVVRMKTSSEGSVYNLLQLGHT